MVALTTAAAMATAVAVAPDAAAQTSNESAQIRQRCAARSDGVFQINVLILVDASGSLEFTDPTLRRIRGVVRSVQTLTDLATRYGDVVDIDVAVDTFSTTYRQHLGWLSPADTQTALDSASVREALAQTVSWTNYSAALRGADTRFAVAPAGRCNLLVWFTDGEHDTETSGTLVPAEIEELSRLCNADLAVEHLVNDTLVTTTAVMLTHLDSPADVEPLLGLFGQRGGCVNPLVGLVQTYQESDALAEQLDEIIAETVSANICTTPLPGEAADCDAVPGPEETETCSLDATTQDCVYEFVLDDSVEAFRLYVDQTALNRGITTPQDIQFRIVPPSGTVTSASVGATADNETGWQQIHPFGFWAFQPYDSRWQILGHRAALTDSDEWAGTWKIGFWSDTEQGRADAQRVAAALRVVQAEEPAVIDMEISRNDTLRGYLHTPRPSRDFIPYARMDLFFVPVTANSEPIHTTRPRLRADPLPVNADDGAFALAAVTATLLQWDEKYDDPLSVTDDCAIVGGGKIHTSVNAAEPVALRTQLEREFVYGPPGNLLTWTTYNTAFDVSEALTETVAAREAALGAQVEACMQRHEQQRRLAEEQQRHEDQQRLAEEQREQFIEWFAGGDATLPDSVHLALSNPDQGTLIGDEPPLRVPFAVSLRSGSLPWTATLRNVAVASDTAAATPENSSGSARGWGCRSHPEADLWSPDTPDATTTRGCDFVDVSASQTGTFSAEVEVLVELDRERLNEYLESIRWAEASPQHHATFAETLADIQPAVLSATAEPVTVAFPRPRGPIFLRLMVPLAALALLLRAVRAFTTRRWAPLTLPEYVVTSLDAGSSVERNVCPDLVARSTHADLIHAKLRSSWLQPLMGRGRRIVAAAPGDCWSPITEHRGKKPARAVLGNSLSDGWLAVRDSDGQTLLIVWDLPTENADADLDARIAQTRQEAAAALADIETSRIQDPPPDTDPDQQSQIVSPQARTERPSTRLGEPPSCNQC